MEDETFYWDGLIGEILNEFLVTSLLALFLISTSLLTKGNLVPRLSLLPFLGAAERRKEGNKRDPGNEVALTCYSGHLTYSTLEGARARDRSIYSPYYGRQWRKPRFLFALKQPKLC